MTQTPPRENLAEYGAESETFRLYEALLSPLAAETEGYHPSSSRLAAYSLSEPDPPDPPDSKDAELKSIARHLETCAECGREVELSRRAVSEARQGEIAEIPVHIMPRYVQPRRLALAASLTLAVLAAGAFWLSRSGEPETAAGRGTGTVLEGVQVIDSPGPLLATNAVIRPQADVTLRANGSVAFGNGFSVGSEATLVVEVTDSESDSHES